MLAPCRSCPPDFAVTAVGSGGVWWWFLWMTMVCLGHLDCGCHCWVTKSWPTVWDPMDCSTPGFPVLHYLLDFAQTHVHWVDDAIQPSHPRSMPSFPALNLSQHQGLFQWVGSSHQVACGRLNSCPQRYAHFNPWNLWILLYMTRLTLYM